MKIYVVAGFGHIARKIFISVEKSEEDAYRAKEDMKLFFAENGEKSTVKIHEEEI